MLDSNDGSAGSAGRSRGSLAHCALMCAVRANASALPAALGGRAPGPGPADQNRSWK